MGNARAAQCLEQRQSDRRRDDPAIRMVDAIARAASEHDAAHGAGTDDESQQPAVNQVRKVFTFGEPRADGRVGGSDRDRGGIGHRAVDGRRRRVLRRRPQLGAGAVEAEEREQRNRDGQRIQDGKRAPVSGPQPQPEMQPDDEMRPDDQHEDRLAYRAQRVAEDGRDDAPVRGRRPEHFTRDSRAEDVRDQQQRHQQAQRELREFPDGHAQRLASPQRV